MLWQVEVETASPDDGIDVQQMVDESVRLLGVDTTTAAVNVDGWIMKFEIGACDPIEALIFATIRIVVAADLALLPLWPVVAMRVLNAEFASATGRGLETS